MAHEENLSIGVFIDGGYFAKIDEGLAKKNLGKVNVKGLFQYIPEMIGRQFGIDRKHLYITEAHYYRGRYRATDADNRNLLLEERQFEDTLIENDIIFHYKHLRPNPSGGVIEKGVDTWFALDTYELTLYRQFNYVVLISGDADHEMLIKKLKALKTDVILLTWDVTSDSSTSKLLREEACTHIEISKLVEENKDLIKKICKK